MKILITSDSYLPRMGGAEIYAYKLGVFLQKEGHQVTMCVIEPGFDKRDEEFSACHRIVISRKSFLVTLRSFVTLFKLINDNDVVHCVFAHKLAAIVGFLRLFTKKTPQVITLQGRDILDLPDNNWFFSIVHRTYRVISLRRATLIIASCREFAEIAARYVNPNKIKYKPNSVDINEFYSREKNYKLLPFNYQNEKIVMTIRRLVPKNGIQFLIETIPSVVKKESNIKFVFIGYGYLEKYLKERVEFLGIGKYVYFLGSIDNYILSDYLNLADLVVFPSTAESTSIACLESMALGKPIIASKVGGYLEMVKDDYNGYLVDLTDNTHSNYNAALTLSAEKINNFANKILVLLQSEEKLRIFGFNSREFIERRFSWQKNIKEILDWYGDIK